MFYENEKKVDWKAHEHNFELSSTSQLRIRSLIGNADTNGVGRSEAMYARKEGHNPDMKKVEIRAYLSNNTTTLC